MARIGVHGRNDTAYTEADYRVIREARIETLKAMSHTGVETFAGLKQLFPQLEIIVRLYDPGIDRTDPNRFVQNMAPRILALQPYVTKFEIHNEPNHVAGIEGWGATDADARDFLAWYMYVLGNLRAIAPWARFGFPGLAVPNFLHRDLSWLGICQEAVRASDWLGCHCYWQYENMMSDEWGLIFKAYHQRFPLTPLEITEFGDSTPNLDPQRMADGYVRYYQELRRHLYIGSASAFIASSPDPQWAQFCWAKGHELMPVVAAVGARPVREPEPQFSIANIVQHLPTNGKYGTRKLSDVQFAVLHHAATPNQDTICARLRIQRIAEYHIRRWGWAGIGYHFVVARDGTIYQTNEITTVSNHAYGQNLRGVGVCLLGTYTKEEPPIEQVKAAAWLLKHLGYPWYDHKHWKGTVCPGIAGDAIRGG